MVDHSRLGPRIDRFLFQHRSSVIDPQHSLERGLSRCRRRPRYQRRTGAARLAQSLLRRRCRRRDAAAAGAVAVRERESRLLFLKETRVAGGGAEMRGGAARQSTRRWRRPNEARFGIYSVLFSTVFGVDGRGGDAPKTFDGLENIRATLHLRERKIRRHRRCHTFGSRVLSQSGSFDSILATIGAR